MISADWSVVIALLTLAFTTFSIGFAIGCEVGKSHEKK